MDISVLFFGQLAEFTGTDKLSCAPQKDTDSLMEQLKKQYPLLIDAAYVVAVNKLLIKQNTILNIGATVALLPPFSGG